MNAADDRHESSGAVGGLEAPPVRLPSAKRGRGRLAFALVAAACLHVATLAAVLITFDVPLGNRGSQTDLVEVTLVPADALQADAAGTAAIANGGTALGDRPGGGTEADAVAGSAHSATAEKSTEAAIISDAKQPPLPNTGEGADASVNPPAQQSSSAAPAASGDATTTSVAGGAPTIAVVPAREVAATPAASEGEVNAYNQRVAVTLSKLKPRGVGEEGLARVVFRIGLSGAVDDVKLASSTGKSKLDRLATETVARAKFETPPTGMTNAQLTYAVAFRFR